MLSSIAQVDQIARKLNLVQLSCARRRTPSQDHVHINPTQLLMLRTTCACLYRTLMRTRPNFPIPKILTFHNVGRLLALKLFYSHMGYGNVYPINHYNILESIWENFTLSHSLTKFAINNLKYM